MKDDLADAAWPKGLAPEAEIAAGGDPFDSLFLTNAAPILLIDPKRDGAIVDANPKAAAFYGYSRERMRRLHVWDINILGREVLPVMHEIASWEGGHHPQRFRHRRADGQLRDVQVYAGPVVRDGRRLLLCIIHDVTAAIEGEHFNRLLLDSIHSGVCGIDRAGNFTFVNPSAMHLFGCQHEGELIKGNILQFIDQGASPKHPILAVARSGQPLLNAECVFRRKGGGHFYARVYATPILRDGAVLGAVVSFSDLTEAKEREAQVTDLANSFPGVVFQAVASPSAGYALTYVSAGAGALLGLPAEARSLDDLEAMTEPGDRPGLRRSLDAAVAAGALWEYEFRVNTPNGPRWLLGRARPSRRPDGSTLFNGVLLDISDRKELEARLDHAAHHDPLTGSWNRRHFERALAEAHARFERHGHVYSLLLIDLDHFKDINDRFGHGVGDQVLCRVAATLAGRLRETDCLARWGGEEFVVLLGGSGAAAALAVAEELRRGVGLTDDSGLPPASISVGVAESRAGETLQGLLRRTDDALYRAKDGGRDRVELAR